MNSNLFFPTLPGTRIEVSRSPQWSTKIHRGSTGTEQRVGWYNAPLYEFILNVEVMREGFSGAATAEASTLTNFYNSMGGKRDSFLFVDPLDGTNRRVRFDDDKLEIERLFSKLWAAKKIKLVEVRS